MRTSIRITCSIAFAICLTGSSFAHGLPERQALTADINAAEAEVCPVPASLITWGPIEVECPVCKTKNTFLQWMSFGSYVYQAPSKYQLVFFPFTADADWWSCKKCRYTTEAGEFKTVPADKLPALQKALAEITLPAQKEGPQKDPYDCPYLGIPASDRLVAAEQIYRALGQGDDKSDFWNFFYRLEGYYFDKEQKTKQADEARHKVLVIIERLMKDDANQGRRKELLYISGSMRHLLREDAAALAAFKEAKELRFSLKGLEAEKNKDYDDYLSKMIDEYVDMLKKGKGPRDQKTDHGDEGR
jgi:hypothetical protein